MRARPPVLLLFATLAALPAAAEHSLVNVHVDPGAGFGLGASHLTLGVSLQADLAPDALGPVAPELGVFALALPAAHTALDPGAAFGLSVGLRLRLFDDQRGAWLTPGTSRRGNLWGNLWLDAHFAYAPPPYGAGLDAGLGYELSLFDGLSVGPFARAFFFAGGQRELLFGLAFTLSAPQRIPRDADFDGDGVKGPADRCPDQPGPPDRQGCP